VKSNDLTVQASSITEGVGQSRVPENLAGAPIDDAERIGDAEALEQIYDLLIHEGLSVGTSFGINVAGAIRVAKAMEPGHTIVTVLSDGGARYASKLFTLDYCVRRGCRCRTGWLNAIKHSPLVGTADVPMILYPDCGDWQRQRAEASCRPFANQPADVEPAGRRLAMRSVAMGLALPAEPGVTADPELHLVVDG
jgi:hypothetical protein